MEDRRSKLKAMAVAPLIMTLPNGGATAQSSFSCTGDESNFIKVRNIKKDETDSSMVAKINGKDYIFEHEYGNVYTSETGQSYYLFEESGRSGNLVSQSCWSSLAVSAKLTTQL